jgi:hypothetical protein
MLLRANLRIVAFQQRVLESAELTSVSAERYSPCGVRIESQMNRARLLRQNLALGLTMLR